MSNTAYTSTSFKPADQNSLGTLLRDLFQATPLYIFLTAAKSAFGKSTQR